jgi:hypothetical protein
MVIANHFIPKRIKKRSWRTGLNIGSLTQIADKHFSCSTAFKNSKKNTRLESFLSGKKKKNIETKTKRF